MLGAGYAGLLATLRLAGKVDPSQTEITLVNAAERFVERIRLHQVAAHQRLRQFSIRDFLRGKAVDFVQGWVKALEPEAQVVQVETPAGVRRIGYDYLLYALGSSAQKTSIPGLAEYAHSVGRPDELRRR